MIARVEPLTRTRAVRGPFDYRLAPGQDVEVGSLLRVPFGARSSLGVVVELAERSELDPERLVAPEAVIGAGVGADLVALAGWMAREYCSTPSRALQLMLAPGAAHGTGAKRVLVAELTAAGRAELADPDARLNDRQRSLLQALAERGATVAAELDTPGLRRLQTRGLVAIEHRARPRRPVRHEVGSASATAPPLTAEQSAALARIVQALGAPAPGHPGFLLQGVTGSGKTEV
jgi:primosomal protein N' (replication factor Y) (superfamily II helicase)